MYKVPDYFSSEIESLFWEESLFGQSVDFLLPPSSNPGSGRQRGKEDACAPLFLVARMPTMMPFVY